MALSSTVKDQKSGQKSNQRLLVGMAVSQGLQVRYERSDVESKVWSEATDWSSCMSEVKSQRSKIKD